MRASTLITVLLGVAIAASCAKKKEGGETGSAPPGGAPTGEQATTATGTPAIGEPGEATGPPVESEGSQAAAAAARTRCEEILGKMWRALQPTLALARLDAGALEARYLESRSFIEVCVGLPAEALECLRTADNPVLAVHSCKVNEGRAPSEQLVLPSIWSDLDSFHDQPLPEAEQKALLASVVGTWVNDWQRAEIHTTWKISETGQVEQTTVRRGGAPETRSFTVSFEKPGRMRVAWSASSAQFFVFLPVDEKTFYAAGNATYGAYPVQDETRFVIRNHTELVAYEAGACTAIEKTGVTATATCEWGADGPTRVFRVSYTLPGQLLQDGSPRKYENTYQLIAGHLLDYRLVGSGKYVRR